MGISLEYLFSKDQKKTLQCSELGEWSDKIEDIGRDKYVSPEGLDKEFVFRTRGNGISTG